MFVNSTNLMAQCSTQTFSVGGTVETDSDTNLESTKPNKKSSNSGNNQIACFDDDLPIEEVTVYGRATIVTFSYIRFWWSPFSGGGNGGGGGSGTTISTQTQVDANKACEALGATDRINLVNLAFIAARILSGNPYSFARSHPHGSTFGYALPNGSVIRGIVSEPLASLPILAEASNSCG